MKIKRGIFPGEIRVTPVNWTLNGPHLMVVMVGNRYYLAPRPGYAFKEVPGYRGGRVYELVEGPTHELPEGPAAITALGTSSRFGFMVVLGIAIAAEDKMTTFQVFDALSKSARINGVHCFLFE